MTPNKSGRKETTLDETSVLVWRLRMATFTGRECKNPKVNDFH